MTKEKRNALIQTLIPLLLLLIFSFCIFFPNMLPFLKSKSKSSDGLASFPFSVPGQKEKTIAFIMKKVPSGTAPSGCTDIPGGTMVARTFLLGETEVTKSVWAAVYSRSLSLGFAYEGGKEPAQDNNRFPVTEVSWRDAIVWCNALSAELGLLPVYFQDAAFLVPLKSVSLLAAAGDGVFVNPDSPGFRLPLSAEWELAARYKDGSLWTPGGNPSGGPDAYYDLVSAADFAVFDADSTAPVKSRLSNALGIYDMSGNVWEWCFDRFDNTSGDKRVVRGGSWIGNAYRLQIGGTFGTLSGALERGQGFRIAKNGS